MPLHAQAQASEWQHHESSDARLIASTKASADGALYVGLHVKLKPNWHTYWRSPGDAGFPPAPEWKEAVNLEKAELLFPWPHRYAMQGLETYGYEGEVVFPIKITKKDQAADIDLKAKLSLLVCSDICIPADFTFDLPLAGYFQSAGDDEATKLIKDALARVPKKDDGQGLSILSVKLDEASGARMLALQYNSLQPASDLEIVGEVGDGSTLPYTDLKHDAQTKTVTVTLTKDAPKELNGKEMIFTLIDNTNQAAVEKKLAINSGAALASAPISAPAVVSHAAAAEQPNLVAMILFALLGGLILNLMPCVLPVIALKSISFIKHGGGTPSGVRLSFLATSAGIIFSFLVMAGIIIALKDIGMSVGWGVQFQNPIFLSVLIVILVFFSLNLFGFYEIPLPRFLADRLSWTHGHGSLTKDFFSGAFATVLATPCTAPFLGTAVGFALAGGAFEILIIFAALGIGLAAPFLLIAIFPHCATWLPKPGAWMENVRKFLGVLLTITALWLGYVLYNQLTPEAPTTHSQAMKEKWEVFDEKRIPELVSQGKIVFVDVTADWCLTCQVNRKLVLETPDVQKILSDPKVVVMIADWTKRDETIGAYLKSFMRYGIPFNVIYSAAMPQGMPLPELLSKEAVLDGLKKAGL
ncbi:MAG: protein-disulfide reductase DsbD family protein [Alphaproteobacteria bacterium]|nr:protein-disulfide reductase DsbD family protein [Alphaproteobacteria bacterium]